MVFRSLVFLLIAFFSFSVSAWDARPEKVAEGVYAFIGETGARTFDNEGMNANTGFIVTPAGVVVIDSGASYEAARKIHVRERIEMGGETIEIIFAGGGHTPGDSIVWLPKQRVAFSGDIVYVKRLLGVIPGSNIKNWLSSFDALAGLQPAMIVPGHGPVTTLDSAKRQTRDYLQTLRDHMKGAFDAGTDIQTAIATLNDGAFSGLENYKELRGGNASRAYLEVEAE